MQFQHALDFAVEAARWRAIGETAASMSVAVIRHPKVQAERKKQLELELLEGTTMNTTLLSEVNRTASNPSCLDKFIERKSRPTLKVIGKQESPYPKYDVLGEFLTKVNFAEEPQISSTLLNQPPEPQLLNKPSRMGSITKLIDLKKYAKARAQSNSSDKENLPANNSQQLDVNTSQESCKSGPAKNLQAAFDAEKEKLDKLEAKENLASMFDTYESTPSKISCNNATCLDPVLQQPEQEEYSKMSIHQQLTQQKLHQEQTYEKPQAMETLSLSEIPFAQEESSELLELESLMLQDLKNDVMKLSWKMSAGSIHLTQPYASESPNLSYGEIRQRLDRLRTRICSEHSFLNSQH